MRYADLSTAARPQRSARQLGTEPRSTRRRLATLVRAPGSLAGANDGGVRGQRMRVPASNGATSVQAIAGTNVVLFGIDVADDAVAGLAGFGIEVDDGSGHGFQGVAAT